MFLSCSFRWPLVLVSLLCLVMLFVESSYAQRTINVPADAPSIQQAIDSASNGDTVVVAPGTYFENINFQGKAINVKGASTAAESIIDGAADGLPVVRFESGETRNSILSNVTIQNGSPSRVPDAGGIYINGSSPTILNNIIQNNFDCGLGIFNGAHRYECAVSLPASATVACRGQRQ